MKDARLAWMALGELARRARFSSLLGQRRLFRFLGIAFLLLGAAHVTTGLYGSPPWGLAVLFAGSYLVMGLTNLLYVAPMYGRFFRAKEGNEDVLRRAGRADAPRRS